MLFTILSIASISVPFTSTKVFASSKDKLICLTPEAAAVYTDDDKLYTITKENDIFYTDMIAEDFISVYGKDLKIKTSDVIVGNDVIQYLKNSGIEAVACVYTDKAEIKPIGSKVVIGYAEIGDKFVVDDISKYSVRILYDEELCYLRRSNVHIQYYLHKLEIPKYGFCDTDKAIENLNDAINKLANATSETNTVIRNGNIRLALTDYALTFVGNRYVWGGTNPNVGADCSGFVQYVYKAFGYNLPRCSYEQCETGTVVDEMTAQPGDLLFFWKESKGRIGHVAIYIGNNQMVEAKSASCGIVTSNVDWNKVYTARSYL